MEIDLKGLAFKKKLGLFLGGTFMKKQVFITLFLLLGVLIDQSLAVEVTLFGPNQYLRTTGKPNVYSDTFPGIPGQGKLIIKNGDANGNNRVSSALISVNGQQILSPNDFNQQVYNIEVPVNLVENNSILVQIQSKPGSYITVKITEEIAADAAAVIGPSGGTITANNGIQAFIPQGATDNSIVAAISYVSPDQLRIDPSEQLGVLGAVNFNIGDAALKINAELTIPKPSNFSAGPQIYLGKIIPLSEKDLIAMVDTASVQGNSITTNSPAINGVLSSGIFPFYTNNTVCGVPGYQNYFAGKINPICTDKLYLRIYLLTEEPILLAQNQNLYKYINGTLTFNDRVQSVISIADTMATLNGLRGAKVEELIADADSEMSEFMANVYGGYWDILALWIPLIACPFTGSCAQELAVTVEEMWFNAWAATQVIYLEEEMNNNLIAMAFFDRYYSYGRNQSLVAQSLGLATGADMDSIVKAVAKTVVNAPWWWPFPSYDVSKIKNIISSGQQWVEAIYKALPPPPGGPWLSFVEGNPGIPGDGILINAANAGTSWGFELVEPIPLGQFTDGFTITYFPLNDIEYIYRFLFYFNVFNEASDSQCRTSSHFLLSPDGYTPFNAIGGIFANLGQLDVDWWILWEFNNLKPGCGITSKDLYINRLGFALRDPSSGSFVYLTTLDAATLLHSQNAVPGNNKPPEPGITVTAQGRTFNENWLFLTGDSGQTVNVAFSAARSFDPDGSIASYRWKIGDQVVSTARDFSYNITLDSETFVDTNNVFVILEAWDNSGAMKLAYTGIIWAPPPPICMTAQGREVCNEPLNLTVSQGQTIRVYFRTSIFANLSPSFEWYINGTQVSTSHSLNYDLGAGTYQILLKWRYNDIEYQDQGTVEVTIIVTESFFTITGINPNPATKNQTVTFTLTGTGFQNGFTAQLINELGQIWPVSSTEYVNSTTVRVTVFLGSGPTSTQTIKIINPNGQSAQINFTALAG